MNFRTHLIGTVALASLALTACNGAQGADEEPLGEAHQEALVANALVANALVANALVANALVANALVANALVANALTSNALVANALVANGLDDPDSRELFTYIVSCALPANQSIDLTVQGQSYSFAGGLGLAPQWGKPGGKCDGDCQEWVSACLLARVDFLGVHREISVRGDNPALNTSFKEWLDYPQPEATYFGNVFTAPEPQRRYACLAPGQSKDTRVCGPSLQGCVVDVDAHCPAVCGFPRLDGSFPDCRPEDGDWNDPAYHGSITVFLKP